MVQGRMRSAASEAGSSSHVSKAYMKSGVPDKTATAAMMRMMMKIATLTATMRSGMPHPCMLRSASVNDEDMSGRR